VTDTGSRARPIDSTLAVATFDSVWRTVGASLTSRGVTRLDWPKVRQELLPRVAHATTDSALRAVIDDMLHRIGESHFAILPPPPGSSASTRSEDDALGTAGIATRLIGNRLVIWRVDSGGGAARAGARPGWAVERIDDFIPPSLGPADSVGPKRLAVLTGAMGRLRGAPRTSVHLVARDEVGKVRDVTFARDSLSGAMARFGNLPPLPASVDFTRRTLPDGRCLGVIRFEYWMPPVMPALDRAVDASRSCAGIILDLRGNLGGVAGMMMGAAGHFLAEPKALGTMRQRGQEMQFVANPRMATEAGAAVQPFAGPLAILVDGLSASTSEMFAAGLQALGRARLFGDRTAGQALPAMATRLPTGDVLMHVVADFVAADGTRIEGKGVQPDEVVPLTETDLLARRDAPLEAAIAWIQRARPVTR
jgi:carboxyl-terminal processing protease